MFRRSANTWRCKPPAQAERSDLSSGGPEPVVHPSPRFSWPVLAEAGVTGKPDPSTRSPRRIDSLGAGACSEGSSPVLRCARFARVQPADLVDARSVHDGPRQRDDRQVQDGPGDVRSSRPTWPGSQRSWRRWTDLGTDEAMCTVFLPACGDCGSGSAGRQVRRRPTKAAISSVHTRSANHHVEILTMPNPLLAVWMSGGSQNRLGALAKAESRSDVTRAIGGHRADPSTHL